MTSRDVVLNKLVVMPKLLLVLGKRIVRDHLAVLVNVFRRRVKTVGPVLLGTQRVGWQLVIEHGQHGLVRGNLGVRLLGDHGGEVVRRHVMGGTGQPLGPLALGSRVGVDEVVGLV